MQKRFFTLALYLFLAVPADAQLLSDAVTQRNVVKGLDALYNFDFTTAERYFAQIDASYKDHPVHDLLKAFVLQWKYLPVEKNPAALKKYLYYLESCQKKAETLLQKPEHKAEATFFLLASHGYVALSYNYRKDYTKAVMDAGQAYGYLKDGFKFMGQNNEFNFTSGVYNFYRVQYPEDHPLVKPVVMFFQNGNKQTGLRQLRTAANQTVFTKVEATTYLTNIYLKYEANFSSALVYAQRLGKRYPRNYVFKLRYVETLLLNNRFADAADEIRTLSARSEEVCKLSAAFFEGYEAEMNQKNDGLATKYYLETLKYSPDSRYTSEYYAMANLGLGRIMKRAGNGSKASYYFKKCLDNAEYHWVIAEAKRAL